MDSNSPAPSSRSLPRRSASKRRLWLEAREFQERAHEALAAERLTFFEWLLLETLAELIDERSEAVSQAEVAGRSGLSERVVSYWMIVMSERELVERGLDAEGRARLLILTKPGERTLRACNQQLEEAGLTG